MSKFKSFFIISCEEAKHICDKAQYGEASFVEKLKLKLRRMWCGATKSYSKKNADLTQLCKEAQLKTMDQQKKMALKKKLEELS